MSTYNQYTKLRFCFPFLSHKAFTIRCVICTLSTSPVAGDTFQEDFLRGCSDLFQIGYSLIAPLPAGRLRGFSMVFPVGSW